MFKMVFERLKNDWLEVLQGVSVIICNAVKIPCRGLFHLFQFPIRFDESFNC